MTAIMQRTLSVLFFATCLTAIIGEPIQGQDSPASDELRTLERAHPDVEALLSHIEGAYSVLFAGLANEGRAVRQAGDGMPTFEFEFETYDDLIGQLDGLDIEVLNREQDRLEGYGVLGTRGAELVHRTQEFYHELLAIYADRHISDRATAVDAALDRYLSRPEVSLSDRPKDMDILFDHPSAGFFASGYPDLNGFLWATHWLQLAAFTPLMTLSDNEDRARGLDTVMTRFRAKLSFGEPPNAFPTELPLAPSIAPRLVASHRRAAVILDNLNMMYTVLADVLVDPTVTDPEEAVEQVIHQFSDTDYRIVAENDWMLMALRHSIFFQGGPALGEMAGPDRNESGHGHHFGGGSQLGPRFTPGM